MKTLLISLAAVVMSVMFIPNSLLAQDIGAGFVKEAATGAGFSEKTTETTFAANLGFIVRIILSFVGVIFLILMVYAGILWMTAQGDETKIEKAQSIIKSAIIGLILTISAYSVTNFVVPRIVGRAAGV